MTKIELLAPAGSMEAFEAALKAGADAIYLGGEAYGARQSAANFSDEAIRTVVTEARKRGVKLYLTINTLVYDHEWHELSAYLDRMAELRLDAWIVQDLGVLQFVRGRYPEVTLHASTQMSAQNLADVETLKSLGVSRVVLPREMRIEEVREIASCTEVELELFIHGALCVSVSGQCYMSSMIGGRSGNRGNCAQSCRQPYDLIDMESGENIGTEKGMYRLSPKDLNTLERIGDVIDAGVTSVKIEGRMKGPEYVYQTVRAYREAIDRHLENKPFDATAAANNFKKIFNRGFTKGWMLGESGDGYLTSEVPGNQGVAVARINAWDARAEEIEIELLETLSVGDELQLRKERESSGCRVEYIISRGQRVKEAPKGTKVRINYKAACQAGDILRRTYDKIEMEHIRAMIHADARRIPVSLHAVLRVGAPVEVVLMDDLGHQGSAVSEALVETALKRPLDHARVSEQLTKLGSTAYVAETVEIEMDDNIMVSVKVLNEARRLAAEALDQARLKRESLPSAFSDDEDDEDYERSEDYEANEAIEFDGSTSGLTKTPITLCASVPDLGRLHLALEGGIKVAYFRGPLKDYEAARTLGNRYGAQVAWQWNRPNPTRMVKRSAETLMALKPEAMVVNSPGMIPWAKTFTDHVIADYGLNVLNLRTAKVVEQLGADGITLSPELTAEAIKRIGHQVGSALEIVGYGHLPVMITPHCPIRTRLGGPAEGCALCSGKYYGLKDKTGAIFPIRKVGPCWTEILNSSVLDLSEYFEMLMTMGVSRYRLHFTIESPDEILRTVAVHIARAKGESVAMTTQMPRTRGHFYRGVK